MYCTPQELVKRFGAQELQDVLGKPHEPLDIQEPVFIAACVDASALVDGYLQRAIPVPLAPSHQAFALLVGISADIARYRLHDDQVREGGDGGKTALRLRYEDALKTLEGIASGRIAVLSQAGTSGALPASPLPLHAHGKIAVVASPVVFDQQTLNKMDYGR